MKVIAFISVRLRVPSILGCNIMSVIGVGSRRANMDCVNYGVHTFSDYIASLNSKMAECATRHGWCIIELEFGRHC